MKNSIFIHGILRRSGTNFLNQTLLLHRSCVQPNIKIRENWFLAHSDPLWEYADKLFHMWSNPSFGGDEFSRIHFFNRIGESLLDVLSENIKNVDDFTLLTKTPSVKNIIRSFDLFPNSKFLIIVRDPRDVAASTFFTWKEPVRDTIEAWNKASKLISEFEKITDPEKYMLIRYEDLVINFEAVTRELLVFLGLDCSAFAWEKLSMLPIFGSSEHESWQVHEKDDSFKPFGKWQHLPVIEKENICDVDNNYLAYFGYSLSESNNFLPLPDRESRITFKFKNADTEPETIVDTVSIRDRFGYLKNGVRLLVKSVLP